MFPTGSAAGPPPPPPSSAKRRGNYNCGRCGLPKKGHVCTSHTNNSINSSGGFLPSQPRRALSFDDTSPDLEDNYNIDEIEEVSGWESFPVVCLTEILRRLGPRELVTAAAVCRGWRVGVKRVWKFAEEVRINVDQRTPIGFVGFVLHNCGATLARLVLTIESDVDATLLARVAFSCPNLEAFQIKIAKHSENRITGEDLGRFVSEKRYLSVLKIEGCTNLGSLSLYSSTLSTLWLSDLYCISKVVINCPHLKELSLDFIRLANDSTDVITMMDCLGRNCPELEHLHIASIHLCDEAIRAMTGAKLRNLRVLSLVLGSEMTDASVGAIGSTYDALMLLDLSGSSITDTGIGVICNAYAQTLLRLFVALCPNITASGIQFATAQLPLLRLLDCGMSLCGLLPSSNVKDTEFPNSEHNLELKRCQMLATTKSSQMRQKLIIKHGHLRKLSLWGCSGLDALYLDCPELNELNLNSCTTLHPERLQIQCPRLKFVYASGCQKMLTGVIENQCKESCTIWPFSGNSRR